MLLPDLAGSWTGRSRLWLSPTEPVRESETTAFVAAAVRDQGLLFRYTWSDGGEPQEGVLVVQHDAATGVVTAGWTDSWHLRDTVMACRGELTPAGQLDIQGTYAAPPGPDWGWQIVIEPPQDDAFTLRMFNISPDGRAELAVEAEYERQ